MKLTGLEANLYKSGATNQRWCKQDVLNLPTLGQVEYMEGGLNRFIRLSDRVLATPWSLSPISNNIWNRTRD
jgi:hypothetical protein